jgi:hypothetical protein
VKGHIGTVWGSTLMENVVSHVPQHYTTDMYLRDQQGLVNQSQRLRDPLKGVGISLIQLLYGTFV